MSLLPVETALARILASVPVLGAEQVPLHSAAGRVLADPVIATLDQPPFDASAMDGYAVRAGDVHPGKRLTVIGTSQAGAGHHEPVPPRSCVRIFTGAPLPPGTDAVIMQEDAERDGDQVSFRIALEPGRNVRRKAFDFARGDVLIGSGVVLTPARLALAASANVAEVSVRRAPRIALLATGDELVPAGQSPDRDQIIASNSIGLAAMFAPYGVHVRDFGIAPDEEAALSGALAEALAWEPDLLVTTGGASVGDHDLVRPTLEALGVEIDFWRIRMRPGKPLMFGRRGDTLVFGLPGNPVSALVTAAVFVRPALRALLQLPPAPSRQLKLAAPLPPNGPRRHFMRGQRVHQESGDAVLPITETDSGHLSSLAEADLLIVQPEDDEGRPKDALVEILQFVEATV